MKPGPKPPSGKAMTHAERQARYRTKQAEGAPTLRYRRPADRRSRFQRWHDAVAELQELQSDYQAWLDALPENMADSGTADAFARSVTLTYLKCKAPCRPRVLGATEVARCNPRCARTQIGHRLSKLLITTEGYARYAGSANQSHKPGGTMKQHPRTRGCRRPVSSSPIGAQCQPQARPARRAGPVRAETRRRSRRSPSRRSR